MAPSHLRPQSHTSSWCSGNGPKRSRVGFHVQQDLNLRKKQKRSRVDLTCFIHTSLHLLSVLQTKGLTSALGNRWKPWTPQSEISSPGQTAGVILKRYGTGPVLQLSSCFVGKFIFDANSVCFKNCNQHRIAKPISFLPVCCSWVQPSQPVTNCMLAAKLTGSSQDRCFCPLDLFKKSLIKVIIKF